MKKITYYCDRCGAEVEGNADLFSIVVNPHDKSVVPMYFEHGNTVSNTIEICTDCRIKVVGFLRKGNEE